LSKRNILVILSFLAQCGPVRLIVGIVSARVGVSVACLTKVVYVRILLRLCQVDRSPVM